MPTGFFIYLMVQSILIPRISHHNISSVLSRKSESAIIVLLFVIGLIMARSHIIKPLFVCEIPIYGFF